MHTEMPLSMSAIPLHGVQKRKQLAILTVHSRMHMQNFLNFVQISLKPILGVLFFSIPLNVRSLVVLIATVSDICTIIFTSNSNIQPFEPAFMELQKQLLKRITTLHLMRCVVSVQMQSIGCWSMPHGSIGLNIISLVIAMAIAHPISPSHLTRGS